MRPSSEAEKPTGQEQQRLTIVIFRGDPIDAPQYRHTALLIEHLNQEGVRTDYRTLEVIGSAGIFEREENATCDPGKSATFVGSVAVATIPVTGSSSSRLRDVIWSTPINNSENSFSRLWRLDFSFLARSQI
ncbi:hypothetical protein GGS24DRAFT_461862 [Hypoxylon argillaceum]|nr:hypothetical protein GGS24DRAFT_461862 [Hypoxylon argillaceum]